jgi:hypothetical protein
MIIQIGSKTNKAKALAKALGEDLITVDGSERSGVPLSPKDILVADLSENLQDSDKELLRSAVIEGATLVLENTNPENMAEYAVVGVETTTAVIKSVDGGRNQLIIIDSPNHQTIGEPIEEKITIESDKSGELIPNEIYYADLARGIFPEELARKEAPEMGRTAGAPATVELSEEEKIKRLALWLKNDTFQESSERSGRSISPEWNRVSGSEANARIVFSAVRWEPDAGMGRGQIAEYFGALEVRLYAISSPFRNKVVKITSSGSGVSMPNGLHRYDDWMKGYFTSNARYMLYPGTQLIAHDEKDRIQLPAQWNRSYIAPQTPNSVTKYTSTTGWSVGITAGGGVTPAGPEASVSLSASYSSSNSEEREIPDFRVRNASSAAVCDWVYEFSQLVDDWTSLFAFGGLFKWDVVKELPQLARNTLFVSNEAVYEAPANATNNQPFVFFMEHQARLLWTTSTHRNMQTFSSNGYWRFTVNMGMVRHPN